MSLTPGTRLGPYEILTPLGSGGMGEVYRAKDTRLDRTVAIKILPTHLSRIAYTSDESGQLDVYIQAFGNHAGKWRVSSNGGRMPSWSKDGKEIFYVTGETQFMSVPIESEPAFKIGTPVPMFQIQMAETGITAENRTEYAISVDGNRFLINKKIEEEVSTPITIITNWTLNLPR